MGLGRKKEFMRNDWKVALHGHSLLGCFEQINRPGLKFEYHEWYCFALLTMSLSV